MHKEFDNVREFMISFGQAAPDVPVMPLDATKHLRWKLCNEESKELGDSTNLAEYTDAVVDLMYVTIGSAIAAGIGPETFSRAWDRVHASNMSKFWMSEEIENIPGTWSFSSAGNGRFVVRDESGKVRKSPSYQPVDLSYLFPRTDKA